MTRQDVIAHLAALARLLRQGLPNLGRKLLGRSVVTLLQVEVEFLDDWLMALVHGNLRAKQRRYKAPCTFTAAPLDVCIEASNLRAVAPEHERREAPLEIPIEEVEVSYRKEGIRLCSDDVA